MVVGGGNFVVDVANVLHRLDQIQDARDFCAKLANVAVRVMDQLVTVQEK